MSAEPFSQNTLRAGDVISTSWEIYNKRLSICLGAGLLTLLIGMLLGVPAAAPPLRQFAVGRGVWGLIQTLIMLFFYLGLDLMLLKVVRGERTDIGELFSGGKYYLTALVNMIVIYIAFGILGIVIALCSFVPILLIPLALAAMFFSFMVTLVFWPFLYIVIDEKPQGIEALKRANELTKGNYGAMVIIFLYMLGLGFVGALACGVGLFYTLPLCFTTLTTAYVKLRGEATVMETAPSSMPEIE
ncbi:hypothetical protein Pan216_40140 [Planctomycetes bacterium Pan216]|uniref:Glycerophosphoryl diester phosphodiesterase membrane domain-containing protein n=1 Tax=Kolteria novifilia TaxID=2527975 RepID=A0A518B842_9BACT|nr:hypothetical protein Pan216_40140 [Planctomycetes bacterium Pan216]